MMSLYWAYARDTDNIVPASEQLSDRSSTNVPPDIRVQHLPPTMDQILSKLDNGSTGYSSRGDDEDMDTQWLSKDYILVGKVESGGKYAVFSCTTTQGDVRNYAFALPLTILAWRRIGFGSVIIISGEPTKWRTDPILSYVFRILRSLNAVVIFLNVADDNEVMVSQTARLFACHFLNSSSTDIYLVTSDADLWPINGDMYMLPEDKDILSLNSDCCGSFDHSNGKSYKMLPIANIGMTLSTWEAVTRRHGFIPQTPLEVLTFLKMEFGPIVLQGVAKGENLGWYLDQRMLSILISDWANSDPLRLNRVEFRPRSVGSDRIDRAWWNPRTIAGKADAHILEQSYLSQNWALLQPLVVQLFAGEDYKFCQHYASEFMHILSHLA